MPIVADSGPAGPSMRRALVVAVATRLIGVTNATGYLGQIGAKNGLNPAVEAPKDPPPKSATDPRVKPYFILEPGIGGPLEDEGSVAGPVDPFRDVDGPFTIRAAGGDVQDVLAMVDRIDALMRGWAPVVDGVQCGVIVPQPGYRPSLLPDNAVSPPRFFTPLQYRLTAHT